MSYQINLLNLLGLQINAFFDYRVHVGHLFVSTCDRKHVAVCLEWKSFFNLIFLFFGLLFLELAFFDLKDVSVCPDNLENAICSKTFADRNVVFPGRVKVCNFNLHMHF